MLTTKGSNASCAETGPKATRYETPQPLLQHHHGDINTTGNKKPRTEASNDRRAEFLSNTASGRYPDLHNFSALRLGFGCELVQDVLSGWGDFWWERDLVGADASDEFA